MRSQNIDTDARTRPALRKANRNASALGPTFKRISEKHTLRLVLILLAGAKLSLNKRAFEVT